MIQVVDARPNEEYQSCWTSEFIDGGWWAQVGWEYYSGALWTFYQVFDPPTYGANLPLVSGQSSIATAGLHTYTMSVQCGTHWAFAVDGNVFGTVDLHGTSGGLGPGPQTNCEGASPPLNALPLVSVPTAISVLNGGTWSGAPSGQLFTTGGNLLFVVGNLQDPTLGNNAVLIGGNGPGAAPKATLWNGPSEGGAVDAGANSNAPPLITIAGPAVMSTVAGTASIAATVSPAVGGAPISLVTISLTDEVTNNYTVPWSFAAPPYVATWDTTQVPDDQFTIWVTAYDANHAPTSVGERINVNNAGIDSGTVDAASYPCSSDGGPASSDAGDDDVAGGNAAGCGCTVAGDPDVRLGWIVALAAAFARRRRRPRKV